MTTLTLLAPELLEAERYNYKVSVVVRQDLTLMKVGIRVK